MKNTLTKGLNYCTTADYCVLCNLPAICIEKYFVENLDCHSWTMMQPTLHHGGSF